MQDRPIGLSTIQDFIRWGASRFAQSGLFFGHGTDNAIDEAVELVLAALHLPADLPGTYREARLTPAERSRVADLIERRIRERRPNAYLTGRARFAGLDFLVTDDVLVPRSPIAELIESAFAPWVDPGATHRVLDLCTGSGCIGIAIAVAMPWVQVDLVDICPSALAVASDNIRGHGLESRVRVIESDLFTALAEAEYDLIVANPPYVAVEILAALPAEFQAEPALALDGGDSGLDLVLAILGQAGDYLAEHGSLVLEVGDSSDELLRRCPDVPFTWIDFERGGDGVLVLSRDQVIRHNRDFVAGNGRP